MVELTALTDEEIEQRIADMEARENAKANMKPEYYQSPNSGEWYYSNPYDKTGVTKADYPPEEPTAWESFGRGADDIRTGIQQLVNNDADFKEEQRVNEEIYQRGRGEDAGFDIPRFVGNVAATLPAALINPVPGSSVAALAANLGIQGSIAGGSMYAPTTKEKVANTVIGGVTGLLLPSAINTSSRLLNKGRNVYGNVRNRVKAAMTDPGDVMNSVNAANQAEGNLINMINADSGRLTNEARNMTRATGDFDPEALLRREQAAQLNFTGDTAPTTAQTTRDPRIWAQERELSKRGEIGDPLLQRYQQQNNRFVEVGDEMQTGTGGTIKTPEELGEGISDAAGTRFDEMQKVVSDEYTAATNSIPDAPAVDLNNVISGDAYANLKSNVNYDKITESFERKLTNLGVLEGGNPTGKLLTPKQVEELRKFMGSVKTDNMSLQSKKDLLSEIDSAMTSGTGVDVYEIARKKASTRFGDFKDNKLLEQIQKGDKIDNTKIIKAVNSSTAKELRDVKRVLTEPDPLNQRVYGQQQWNDLKANTLQKLWSDATANRGQFSGTAFSKGLDKLGDDKMRVLFTPDEYLRLQQVSKVGKDLTYEPAFTTTNTSNTASTVLNSLGDMATNLDIASQGANYLRRGVQEGVQRDAVSGLLSGGVQGGRPPWLITPTERTKSVMPYLGLMSQAAMNDQTGGLL